MHNAGILVSRQSSLSIALSICTSCQIHSGRDRKQMLNGTWGLYLRAQLDIKGDSAVCRVLFSACLANCGQITECVCCVGGNRPANACALSRARRLAMYLCSRCRCICPTCCMVTLVIVKATVIRAHIQKCTRIAAAECVCGW